MVGEATLGAIRNDRDRSGILWRRILGQERRVWPNGTTSLDMLERARSSA